MSKFIGFVARISKKEGQTARGPWVNYSAKIEKADGSEYEDWVSFGFDNPPPFKEGDYVEFDTENKNGREVFVAGSGKKPKNPPARAQKQQASKPANRGGYRGGGGGGQKFDGTGIQNKTNPQDAQRMGLSAARTAALETVSILLAQNGLPLSKAATKAGEAKRYEEIIAQIDKLTVRFYHDTVTGRLLETVADEGVVSTEGDGPLPDDAESKGQEDDNIDAIPEEDDAETF